MLHYTQSKTQTCHVASIHLPASWNLPFSPFTLLEPLWVPFCCFPESTSIPDPAYLPCPLSKMLSVANTCAWWLVSVFYLRLSCPQKACLLTYLWSKSSHAIACDDHPSGLLGSVWVDSGILKVVDCTLIPQIHKYIKGRGRNPAQPLEMLLLGCLTISRCWINVC